MSAERGYWLAKQQRLQWQPKSVPDSTSCHQAGIGAAGISRWQASADGRQAAHNSPMRCGGDCSRVRTLGERTGISSDMGPLPGVARTGVPAGMAAAAMGQGRQETRLDWGARRGSRQDGAAAQDREAAQQQQPLCLIAQLLGCSPLAAVATAVSGMTSGGSAGPKAAMREPAGRLRPAEAARRGQGQGGGGCRSADDDSAKGTEPQAHAVPPRQRASSSSSSSSGGGRTGNTRRLQGSRAAGQSSSCEACLSCWV